MGQKFVLKLINGGIGYSAPMWFDVAALAASHKDKEDHIDPILILRPLSDMTEEERKELNIIQQNDSSYPTMAYALAPHFKYLLSKGFDFFGLIEAGLALKKSQ